MPARQPIGCGCFLFPAPLVVDSAETKRRLIEACGLSRVYALAEALDISVISAGDIGTAGTSLASHLVPPEALDAAIANGAVCDVMGNFLDASGASVPSPVENCIMSIGLDLLARTRHIVMACGGERRAVAILAAVRRIGYNTPVTDERTAQADWRCRPKLTRLAREAHGGA